MTDNHDSISWANDGIIMLVFGILASPIKKNKVLGPWPFLVELARQRLA
jgi:hypothetical protein